MAGWCRGQLCQSIDPGSHEWLNNQPKVIWRWMVFRWFFRISIFQVDFWGAKAASQPFIFFLGFIFSNFFFSSEKNPTERQGSWFSWNFSWGFFPVTLAFDFFGGGRCFSKRDFWWLLWVFFLQFVWGRSIWWEEIMVFFPTCNKNCKKLVVFCPKVILAKDRCRFFSWENQSWLWSCFVFFFQLGLVVMWCFKTAFHAPSGCWDRLGWNGVELSELAHIESQELIT